MTRGVFMLPSALAWLILVGLTPLVGAQAVDARTARAIEEKQAALDEADRALQKANLELQDAYAAFEQGFFKTKAGQAQDVVRDLRRALQDPLIEARAGNGDGSAISSRGRRAFERALPKALDKLETDLLKALKPRLRNAANQVLESRDLTMAELDVDRLATLTQEIVFGSDVEFWNVWNETIGPGRAQTERFAQAWRAKAKLEQELLVLRDPKMAYTLDAPPHMARIPAGNYSVEAEYGFKKKRRKAKVKAFYIDLYEVSHEDYWQKFFVNVTDRVKQEAYLPRDQKGNPLWIQDEDSGVWVPSPDIRRQPVTGIDGAAALAYALHLGKRLPTEAEWCAAASGEPGKVTEYPWGDEYRDGMANDRKADRKGPIAVDAHPEARSAFGVYQMSGNVKEWTSTSSSGKDFTEEIPADNLVLRGGSFESDETGISVRWRWEAPGYSTRLVDVGFRCAQDTE